MEDLDMNKKLLIASIFLTLLIAQGTASARCCECREARDAEKAELIVARKNTRLCCIKREEKTRLRKEELRKNSIHAERIRKQTAIKKTDVRKRLAEERMAKEQAPPPPIIHKQKPKHSASKKIRIRPESKKYVRPEYFDRLKTIYRDDY